MKQITVKIDGSIPITEVARALATIGCTLSSDASGDMRVSKRRIRAARPAAAVVDANKPDKK